MENLVKKLTAKHLDTLKLAVQRAQEEYLTTNISDSYSVAVLVNGDLGIQTGYNAALSDNQIRIHICSKGTEARWQHFAQANGSLDGFLVRNGIVLGDHSFTERLRMLEEHFPLAFVTYRQQTLDWVTTEFWSVNELIQNAITSYQERFFA